MNICVLVVGDEPLRFAESSGGDEGQGGTVALVAIHLASPSERQAMEMKEYGKGGKP